MASAVRTRRARVPSRLRAQRPHASDLAAAGASPTIRVAAAHAMALLVTGAVLIAAGPANIGPVNVWLALGIAVGFGALRVMSVRKSIAVSTVVLDAAGMVLFLAGTNAPLSPFYPFALAGVWWAAQVRGPRTGIIYGASFAAAYLLVIGPQAIAGGLLAEAVEDAAVLVIIAALSDWFVRVDRRAVYLSEMLSSHSGEQTPVQIRQELQRAIGMMDVPVDVVLAAAQVGLTVIQAELLAYLVLGFTNRQIAEATHVSESTVRYRLTRLYRALGVTGRHEAVRRAMRLGLELPTEQAAARRPG